MDIKGFIYSTSPHIMSKIIAAVVALIIALTGVKIALVVTEEKDKTPDGGTTDPGNTDVGANGNDGSSEQKSGEFDYKNALKIGSVINGNSAILCRLGDNTIIAEKNMFGAVTAKDITVFMTALTVSKAVSEGRVLLTDEAVCPASAAKKPNYSLSEEILSIGKRMKIGDILRCMLYHNGSSYAYTLAVHISGSEEAFVNEMNEYAKSLKLTSTFFTNCTGEEDLGGKVSVYDAAVIIKYVLNDPMLKEIICSNDMLTVSHGQSGSVSLVVKNDFFENYCTESQAKNDGIAGGKVSCIGYYRWAFVLFSDGESEYISLVLDSKDPFTDALMLYSAYALCSSGV